MSKSDTVVQVEVQFMYLSLYAFVFLFFFLQMIKTVNWSLVKNLSVL